MFKRRCVLLGNLFHLFPLWGSRLWPRYRFLAIMFTQFAVVPLQTSNTKKDLLLKNLTC